MNGEPTMHESHFSVDHHLSELQQVAADLRAERTSAAADVARPGRLRTTLGRALIGLGESILGSTGRRSSVRRTPLASH